VAFADTERLIGDPAKNQVAMNPSNTIFGKKTNNDYTITKEYIRLKIFATVGIRGYF
jgi:molecular chaperone DnaK (HSP70)